MRLSDLDAYEQLEERELSDINSVGMLLRHKKSGARIAVISNDDENKVFYVGFRTPPEDSTGVPHIVEHTVLCGSQKYPVKDPFVELVKGSLNTFLNAMTYPDKTIYPVASCHDIDFQNLMGVYMDAVFHPNIYHYEEIFKQEGWHYELKAYDEPITINGVVYNEMKGAFSSQDEVRQREILRSLFPNTCYANESGGDPDCIPDLTYEQYLDFHRRYYHPSNSYIYLYGDMDIAEKLRWMDEQYLGKYDKIEPNSEIGMQRPFDAPIEITKKYSISSEESEENNTSISCCCVVGTILDKTLYQAFDVLDYALLNAPGAPLKQALIDAGIGNDIVGGYENYIRQPIFSITAKNTNPSEKERFVAVVQSVLKEQVKDGINKKALLAGISRSEFKYREADFGHLPKGLLYGIQCLDSWLYEDSQPFLHLEALETYRFLKEQVNTGYFEKLVQKYLLDNPHASVVIIEPKKGLNVQREKELTEKLARYKAGLSKEELMQLIAQTDALLAYQEEPSAKEDLEKLPMLKREDMKKEAAPLQNAVSEENGTTYVCHEMFSGGIDYLTLLFDIRDMELEKLPYLGILKAVLGYVDTESYTYAELANEMNIQTGGMASSVGLYPSVRQKDEMEVKYEISTKVLHEKLPKALGLIREILLTSKISDEKRLYEVLAEQKSRMQVKLSAAGHTTAVVRAGSYLSRVSYYQDAIGGIGAYRLLTDYEENFESKKAELIRILEELLKEIFTAERMMVSLTCEKKEVAAVKQEIEELKKAMPLKGQRVRAMKLPAFCPRKKNEGFLDASQVQYVARVGNFVEHGFSYHGTLKILNVLMQYDYLWQNVRVKGGAYGCMSNYMRNGDTYFVSYRDPNLSATNEVYEGIPEYLAHFSADEREMTKYIIGTISSMDTPLNPSAKGERSMAAYLQGITEEALQKERDEVISAVDADIRKLSKLVAAVLSDHALCVIGNEEKLKEEKELFDSLTNLYQI